jgi:hypothetical protein
LSHDPCFGVSTYPPPQLKIVKGIKPLVNKLVHSHSSFAVFVALCPEWLRSAVGFHTCGDTS